MSLLSVLHSPYKNTGCRQPARPWAQNSLPPPSAHPLGIAYLAEVLVVLVVAFTAHESSFRFPPTAHDTYRHEFPFQLSGNPRSPRKWALPWRTPSPDH